MAAAQQPVTNPRLVKLMELEAAGRIKPEHQAELDSYRTRGVINTPKALTEGEAKATNFYNSAFGAENEWKALEADPALIDAASSDITGALNAANPRAAAAYQRADRFYAQRQRYIKDVIQHYTGPRDRPISGEQAYARIVALTGQRGDRERLVETMRALSPDERADVATTIASQLGRRAPDDDFSPARFVTQAEKMTAGAREAVFGTDGAAAVEDLIRIASAKRDTGNSLNRSRSGQVSNYNSLLTGAMGLLGAGGGYAAGGAGGAALGAVAAGALKAGALNLSARVMTNRQFVQWLGRAPTSATPAQITAHVRQLSNVAIRQPAIRGELEQLQRMLGQTSVQPSLAADGAPGNDQQGNRDQSVAAVRQPPIGGHDAK